MILFGRPKSNCIFFFLFSLFVCVCMCVNERRIFFVRNLNFIKRMITTLWFRVWKSSYLSRSKKKFQFERFDILVSISLAIDWSDTAIVWKLLRYTCQIIFYEFAQRFSFFLFGNSKAKYVFLIFHFEINAMKQTIVSRTIMRNCFSKTSLNNQISD